MTREELHELVDIVMDAREKGYENMKLRINDSVLVFHNYDLISSANYPTFSDFTQAVKDYIKTLER